MAKAINIVVVHTSAVFALKVLEYYIAKNPRFAKPIWDHDLKNDLRSFCFVARRYTLVRRKDGIKTCN